MKVKCCGVYKNKLENTLFFGIVLNIFVRYFIKLLFKFYFINQILNAISSKKKLKKFNFKKL